MSYFVFGLIELREAYPGIAMENLNAQHLAESCAVIQGIFAHIGITGEASILREMRGDHSPVREVPFFLTLTSTDDTSDSLISPYVVGIDGIAVAAKTIEKWAACLLQSDKVHAVKIWFTEGYDDHFEEMQCFLEELAALIAERVQSEGDVPSLQIRVVRPPGAKI